MRIVIHIERLLLDGIAVPGPDRQLLRSSLEVELGRLLSSGNGMHQWRHGDALPTINAGDIRTRPGANGTILGKQIAGAVYNGLGKVR